jgi:ectoine hydroxylase-related dioxygenase (phytanoyl-CoA dioxygenase family)
MNWNDGRLTRQEIIDELDENGYVVIQNVLTSEQCTTLLDQADQDLQYMTTQIMSVSEPSIDGWDKKLRPVHRSGYMDSYGITTAPHVMKTREAVAKVYERLFPTDHVWTSFEGSCIDWFRKKVDYPSLQAWQDDKNWAKDSIGVSQCHDSAPYQSYVSLTNEHTNHNVFICIPRSHRLYKRLTKRVKQFYGFQPLNTAAIEYLRDKKKLFRVRIPLKAGSMILFDSKLVHGTTGYCHMVENNHVNVRVKVTMSPLPRMSEQALEKLVKERIKIFKSGVGSTHIQFPKMKKVRRLPRKFGRTYPHIRFFVPPEEMNQTCAMLHGLVVPEPLHEVKRIRITTK